jgi:hypothetical protein
MERLSLFLFQLAARSFACLRGGAVTGDHQDKSHQAEKMTRREQRRQPEKEQRYDLCPRVVICSELSL